MLTNVQSLVGFPSSSLASNRSSLPDLAAALKPSRHGASYAHLLAEARQHQQQHSQAQYDGEDRERQEAAEEEWQQLDDPNIQSGRHRVVLPLPGLMSSVISFVRGKELKQQLNAQFRQKVSSPSHTQLCPPSSQLATAHFSFLILSLVLCIAMCCVSLSSSTRGSIPP